MKIVALLGSRANPKGEEWDLAGYHLIQWPYTAACYSKYIGKRNTYISTNSRVLWDKLIETVGKDNWISRPGGLATDTATDYDWINHALMSLRLMRGTWPDLIVLLRQTTPLIDPDLIDRAIEEFQKHPAATSLRSAHKLPESPYKMFQLPRHSDYWEPFMPIPLVDTNKPRQGFTDCYAPNGYVDILRPSTIETGDVYGDKILAFETPRVIEIDDKESLIEAELHIEDCPLWNNKFNKLVEVQ